MKINVRLTLFFTNSSLFFLLSSPLRTALEEISLGFHDDENCIDFELEYANEVGQELPVCQFKANKSKIQSLIRKVHVDANGSVKEVQFDKGSC